MSKNTSISLGNHFENFISTVVKKGRFNSASEVIREGLRLLEERESKLMALNNALELGEKSGFVEDFDPDVLLEKLHEKHKNS